jgi:hypothetical protein
MPEEEAPVEEKKKVKKEKKTKKPVDPELSTSDNKMLEVFDNV